MPPSRDDTEPDDPQPLPGLVKLALTYIGATFVAVIFLIGLSRAFF